MTGEIAPWIGLAMFPIVFAAMFAGFPVAYTLAGTALLVGLAASAFDLIDLGLFASVPLRTVGLLDADLLQALPVFVYLGAIVQRTGIAAEMQSTMADLFARRAGGLAFATLLLGALLAPATGAVGATVLTLGGMALPRMIDNGYDKRFASGLVCAAGTLGTILPPSIVLILMAEAMRGAIADARVALMAQGRTDVPALAFVAQDIYAGALVPVAALLAIYAAYIGWTVWRHPERCPPPAARRPVSLRRLTTTLILPAAALLVTLAAIVEGWVYTVEAAASAALAVTLYAVARRELDFAGFRDALRDTIAFVGVIFLLLMAASVFAMVFRGFGSDVLLHHLLASMPGGTMGAVAAVMVFAFVFGFFLDAIETVTLIVPIAMPALIALGADVVWLSVLMAVKVQTSFLVPPSGFAVFFLRATAPKSVRASDIHRGVVPFIMLQLVLLAILWAAPDVTHALAGRKIAFGPAGATQSVEPLDIVLPDEPAIPDDDEDAAPVAED